MMKEKCQKVIVGDVMARRDKEILTGKTFGYLTVVSENNDQEDKNAVIGTVYVNVVTLVLKELMH
mgnify:CR=1 FL=1